MGMGWAFPIMPLPVMCEEGVGGDAGSRIIVSALVPQFQEKGLCGKRQKKYQNPVKRSARLWVLPQ